MNWLTKKSNRGGVPVEHGRLLRCQHGDAALTQVGELVEVLNELRDQALTLVRQAEGVGKVPHRSEQGA